MPESAGTRDTDAGASLTPPPDRTRTADRPPGTVLHDLNNILMTIVMHADLLLDEIGKDSPARDRINAIIAAVDRGSELTRQERAPIRETRPYPDAAETPVETAAPVAGTILLAEDDPMVRKTIGRLLGGAGYAVVQAVSGNEAIRRLEMDPEAFDLVVTDVVMPDGTGRDLADFLWRTAPEMKLIFMTGYTEDSVISDGELRTSRGWQILRKPFRPRLLLSAVAEAIGKDDATG